MRVLIQRVESASVHVDGEICGEIGKGLLVFLGICHTDTVKEAHYLAEKVATLRVFTDDAGKMNLSLQDLHLQALVVSQFTLYANCMNGRRPDFIEAADPAKAEPLYREFISCLEKKLHHRVAEGRFGAEMQVHLVNDGPVTLLIENSVAK
jgi:D-tyrosyl-tRNA(Tyr) deacylase